MAPAGLLLALLLPFAGGEEPPGAPPAPPPSPVAAVVAAVAKSAAENAALPETERVAGDALFDRYVRAAAAAAAGDVRSLLLGLGHAVDPNRTLERFNLTKKEFVGVETDEARTARLAALGKPSLRGRTDHVLHFVVAAALTASAGAKPAEALALLKERMDAVRVGGTGISFADIVADLAGIRFAEWLGEGAAGKARAKGLAAAFSGAAVMPDASGETEGMKLEEFEKRFGTFQDERFLAERKRMMGAIEALEAYKPVEEGKDGGK